MPEVMLQPEWLWEDRANPELSIPSTVSALKAKGTVTNFTSGVSCSKEDPLVLNQTRRYLSVEANIDGESVEVILETLVSPNRTWNAPLSTDL